VQRGGAFRGPPGEIGVQVPAQQGVHAVARRRRVDPDDERGRLGGRVEQRRGVGPAGQVGREVHGHLLADADRAEELVHLAGQPGEHLTDQVRRDRPVVRGELGEQPVRLGGAGQRHDREPQPGRPAFGLLEQPAELVRVELDLRGLEQRPRLAGGEPQVVGADLAELVGEPQPGERQPRVVPAGQDQPQAGRLVAQQGLHALARLRVGHLVDVVEHQHDGVRQVVERVDDLGEEAGVRARTPRHRQPRERAAGRHGPGGGQRVEQRRPEPAVVVVVRVQRHPGHLAGVPLPDPLRQQQRLARACRAADQVTMDSRARSTIASSRGRGTSRGGGSGTASLVLGTRRRPSPGVSDIVRLLGLDALGTTVAPMGGAWKVPPDISPTWGDGLGVPEGHRSGVRRQYEFRVMGRLSERAQHAVGNLGEMRVEPAPPETLLYGAVTDQAHLHGILVFLENLGLHIVSVHHLPAEPNDTAVR
jgi:hypothetical protein